MRRVRFLETRTVQREGGPTYEKGSVHFLPDRSAQHWINRGSAEAVEDPSPVVIPKVDPAKLAGAELIPNPNLEEELKAFSPPPAPAPQLEEPASEKKSDGNVVASPQDLVKPDGGDTGVRSISRRRGRPPGSGSRNPHGGGE